LFNGARERKKQGTTAEQKKMGSQGTLGEKSESSQPLVTRRTNFAGG